MTKSEFVDQVADRAGLSKKDAGDAVARMEHNIEELLAHYAFPPEHWEATHDQPDSFASSKPAIRSPTRRGLRQHSRRWRLPMPPAPPISSWCWSRAAGSGSRLLPAPPTTSACAA